MRLPWSGVWKGAEGAPCCQQEWESGVSGARKLRRPSRARLLKAILGSHSGVDCWCRQFRQTDSLLRTKAVGQHHEHGMQAIQAGGREAK